MDVSVDKSLVPFGLAGLLHCFCPSFALVTVCVSRSQQVLRGILVILINEPPHKCAVAIPAVREEVYFDISAPGPSVRPQRELYSLKHIDN